MQIETGLKKKEQSLITWQTEALELLERLIQTAKQCITTHPFGVRNSSLTAVQAQLSKLIPAACCLQCSVMSSLSYTTKVVGAGISPL